MKRARSPRAWLAALALAGCGTPAAPRPPDLLLVVLDTVRADRLSGYGHPQPTSPNLDALAARGIRFEDATSTSSWTLPAHASLFTGLHAIRHGATQEHARLEAGSPTLAEQLAARGYATFAASANPLVSHHSGLSRGFREFHETWRARAADARGRHPNQGALEDFLKRLPGDRPFFAFLNYIEAHAPNDPPEPFRSRFLPEGAPPGRVASAARRLASPFYLEPGAIGAPELEVVRALYDGELAYVDALLGRLLEALDHAGRLRDAAVFVTSDHGENLGDHGHFRHVFSLYRTTVRVPLVARLPGDARAGQVIREPVDLVDLSATLLALAGVDPRDPSRMGRDLLGPLEAARPRFAEYYRPLQALEHFPPEAARDGAPLARYLRRLRSVDHGGLRLIWSSDGRHELFDLRGDADERRDVSADPAYAGAGRRLHSLLDGFVTRGGGEPPPPPAPRAGQPDEESARRLRDLGYLR